MNSRSTALDAYDPNSDDYTADLETVHVTSDTLSSDSILMAQLCQQDRQALGVLYDRYGTLVYTLALRMTGNRAAAEAVAWTYFRSAGNPQIPFKAVMLEPG